VSDGEDKIVKYFAEQSRADAKRFPIGIGDDMAMVRFDAGGDGSCDVLITTDMLLDGVHFDLSQCTLEQAGYKAMAVSLSDCAAMASRPVCAVVSVALPSGFGADELKQLHKGIVKAGEMFDCELIGGDITAWGGQSRFAISVAMLSRPGEYGAVRRSGAQVGDAVCVTGELGGSIFGKHLRFVPRVREAIRLTELVSVHAMMDISDGLSSDLQRMCRSSGVGCEIYAEAVPISADVKKTASPLESALHDGEDFELLFTVSQADWEKLAKQWDMPVPLSKVGVITDSRIVEIITVEGDRNVLEAKGYDHLK